jgi:hypothetical protein
VSKKTSKCTYLSKNAALTHTGMSQIIMAAFITLHLIAGKVSMTPIDVINLWWYNVVPPMDMQILYILAQANFLYSSYK